MAIPNNFNNVSSEDSKGRMGTDCKQESDTSSPTEESQAEVGEVKISSRRNRRRREQYSLGKRSYQKIVKTESHIIGNYKKDTKRMFWRQEGGDVRGKRQNRDTTGSFWTKIMALICKHYFNKSSYSKHLSKINQNNHHGWVGLNQRKKILIWFTQPYYAYNIYN